MNFFPCMLFSLDDLFLFGFSLYGRGGHILQVTILFCNFQAEYLSFQKNVRAIMTMFVAYTWIIS